MGDRYTYPLFGQAKERVVNGKQTAWLETIEITPLIKNEDGTFKGAVIYSLMDLKEKNKIEKQVVKHIIISFGGDKNEKL